MSIKPDRNERITYMKMMGTDVLECHICNRVVDEYKRLKQWGETIFVCAATESCKQALHDENIDRLNRIKAEN